MTKGLVLASASPRRAELLRAAGYSFDVVAVDLDERVRAGEAPSAYVARLAREKSAAALQQLGAPPDAIVVGADTAVVVDGRILGKPSDDRDGAAMLEQLSGRKHDVLTGVSVRTSSGEWQLVESTSVYMRTLSKDDIAWYVESGEGRDKAGGYAVQGLASRFIPRIDGSYANVVGLPVASVELLLREAASAR